MLSLLFTTISCLSLSQPLFPMSQVLSPTDVLKLGMAAAFYVFQGLSVDSNCVLSEWLLNLWKMLVFEIMCKFLIQACDLRNVLTSIMLFFIQLGEAGWNLYGLYLFFQRPQPMRCTEETSLAFQIALGLYVASNVSAVLLGCCHAAEPPKPKLSDPAGLRSRTPERTASPKPHSN